MKTGPRTTHGPKDIIRVRRDGHVVRIPKPVLVIDDPELAERMLREESVQGRSQPDRQ
jgi:hypothetical protein